MTAKRFGRPRHLRNRPHGHGELRDFLYKQLAERLKAIGIHETERNLNNMISRGGFSAVFLIQCLAAAGCHTVRIPED